jgi:hypothetical protein
MWVQIVGGLASGTRRRLLEAPAWRPGRVRCRGQPREAKPGGGSHGSVLMARTSASSSYAGRHFSAASAPPCQF